MASVPVIIAIITIVVFLGIVVAAISQERKQARINPELEKSLQQRAEPGVEAGAVENVDN